MRYYGAFLVLILLVFPLAGCEASLSGLEYDVREFLEYNVREFIEGAREAMVSRLEDSSSATPRASQGPDFWRFRLTPVPIPSAELEAKLRWVTFFILTGDQPSRLPSGTAFIVNPDGTMLTAFHVVDFNENGTLDSEERLVDVYTDEGSRWSADAFCWVGKLDIAAMRLEYPKRSDWPHLRLGYSQDIEPGTPVYLLGYDEDWNRATFRLAHVAGRARVKGQDYFVLDITAFPGSSGGPVVTTEGEVIGVVVEVAIEEGLTLAVPSQHIPKPYPCYGQSAARARPTPPPPSPVPVAETPPSLPSFSTIIFSDGIAADWRPTNPRIRFPAGTRVYACFDFEGMSDGVSWTYTWYRDGKELQTETDTWRWGESGPLFLYYDGLPKGSYELRLFIGGVLQQSASLTVE